MQEPPGERKPWLALLPAPRSPPACTPPDPSPVPPPGQGCTPPGLPHPSTLPGRGPSAVPSLPHPGGIRAAPLGPAPSSPLPRPRPAHPAAPRPSRTAPRAAAPARPWLHPRAPPPRPARTPGSPPRGAGRGGGQPGFLSGGVGAGCLDLLGEGTQTPGCPGGGGQQGTWAGGAGRRGDPRLLRGQVGTCVLWAGWRGAGGDGNQRHKPPRDGDWAGSGGAAIVPWSWGACGRETRAGGTPGVSLPQPRPENRGVRAPSPPPHPPKPGVRVLCKRAPPPVPLAPDPPPPRGLVPFVPRRRAQHWGGGGRESGGPGARQQRHVPMAARGYTVLILPLGSALGSWDALRGFLRVSALTPRPRRPGSPPP